MTPPAETYAYIGISGSDASAVNKLMGAAATNGATYGGGFLGGLLRRELLSGGFATGRLTSGLLIKRRDELPN